MALPFTLSEVLSVLINNITTILVFVVTFLAARWYLKKPPPNLPPVVRGAWPLVGHLPALYKNRGMVHVLFNKWAKKYGDICTFNVDVPVVIVSGYKAVKEMLDNDVFSNRIDSAFAAIMGKKQDILMAPYGEIFKERRKFAASALRRLGMKMGPEGIQHKIEEEAHFLCDRIAGYGGEAKDISADVANSVANVICTMVFYKRFDFSDTKFQDLLTVLKNLGSDIRRTPMAMPFITYIPFAQDRLWKVRANAEKLQQFIRDEIKEHRQTFNPEHPRDFIDYCLAELASQNGGGTWLKDDDIVYIVMDLFIAGTDTTVQTLSWAFLFMILNPDTQEKVQAEIDSVLGLDKPCLALRQKLPYTVATIMEIQRLGQIAPAIHARISSEPTHLQGFDFPKGTSVLSDLLSLHMDPEFWPDPEKFDPCRFLDKERKVITKPPSYVPFSTGRRNCLGEQLAKMELFLFFSNILQQFTLKVPEGASPPSTNGTFQGLSIGPSPFKLCAIPRTCGKDGKKACGLQK